MSAWVSAAPVIGSGSLDGFAIGALMSGACALAITAPRHARRPLAAGRPRGGRDGRSPGGYRSRHRRGDPISVCAPRDGLSPGRVSLQSAFPLVGLSGGRWWRSAYPDVVFPDAELTGSTLAGRRRPEARRLPRHAAPSAGLGGRITGIGSRMTGPFADRALASGARG